MRTLLWIIIFNSFLISLVKAQDRVKKICQPLAKQKKWIRGNTVYWTSRVAPAFEEIAKTSEYHAIQNTTFKSSLSSYFDDGKINEKNKLRLQNECDINQLESCHHFNAYCINSITTDTLHKTFDSFNHCAIYRRDYCGETFQTPEGIQANFNELEKAHDSIKEVWEDILEKPHLKEYFDDVERSYNEIQKRLEEARKNTAKIKKELEKEIQEEFEKQRAQDKNFDNCCDVLNECKDYLESKKLTDKHQLLDQSSFCQVTGTEKKTGLSELETHLKEIQNKQSQQSLKTLAIKSLDNSIAQTIKEYALTYKALSGSSPSTSQMCKDMPRFCHNDTAKKALDKISNQDLPAFSISKEIETYNQYALKMNQLCKKASQGHITPELEQQISSQLQRTMYNTKVGQLMAVRDFREHIEPFDQSNCYKKGVGFKSIPSGDTGRNLFKQALKSLTKLQSDKSNKIHDLKSQLQYAGKFTDASDPAYYKIIKDIIRNDPYMARQALRKSGSPEQAMWICKATHDIYKTDRNNARVQGVLTGLIITGAIVGTVLSGGLAGPALLGATMVLTAGSGIYNLNKSITARHNTEQTLAIQSADTLLSSMELNNVDANVKAAYVELAMVALPGALKGVSAAGKAIGPTLKASRLLSKVPTGSALSKSSQAFVNAIKSGQKISQKMIQNALASKLPNASPEKLAQFTSIIQGASADAGLEIIAFASAYPDPPGPFSAQGMKTLAISLASSTAMNGLSVSAKAWVNSYRSKLEVPVSQRQKTSVYQDANTLEKKQAIKNFEDEVTITKRVLELKDNAHNAPSGYAKNKQIKLLVDEVSTQKGMSEQRAKELVLGVDDGSGIKKSGLASEDVMVLGAAQKNSPITINSQNDITQLKNQFSDKANITSMKVTDVEDQAQYLVKNIQGLSYNDALAILQRHNKFSQQSSIVFGGSRIRGNSSPSSDLDIGFHHLSVNQTNKRLSKIDAVTQIEIERKIKITTGNETKSIKKIESPEEFFMRSGKRSPDDPKSKVEPNYIPSGSISIYPDGTIIKIEPKL